MNRPLHGARRLPRRLRLLACLLIMPLATACATIPEESQPQAVPGPAHRKVGGVPLPARDVKPSDLVRDFVRASGNRRAAEMYLTNEARAKWLPDVPTIIDDIFSTLPPGAEDFGPNVEPPESEDETVVRLRGRFVGRLGADHAFAPNVGNYEQLIRLRKQDGQWRISEPPSNLVLTTSDFAIAYRPVSLQFLGPDQGVLVPDPRYVLAQPLEAVPQQVIERLLEGPSDALTDSVRSAIGPEVTLATNVIREDGALTVDLTSVGDQTEESKTLMAAQIVASLKDVVQTRVRVHIDGLPLRESEPTWRLSDFEELGLRATPNAQLPGLYVGDGRVRSLRTGEPVPGPVGAGEYQIVSAAQSMDGQRLAVVERVGGGNQLRVGGTGDDLTRVDLPATSMTRPTWRPAASGRDNREESREVWTVADGNVVRVVNIGGSWTVKPVNAPELAKFGPITDLRLSRDGVRVAAIADRQLLIGSVVRDPANPDSVAIRATRPLQQIELTEVTGVDWYDQDTLTVVATPLASPKVANVEVDGLKMESYNSSNLSTPLTAITVAPSRPVVVTDATGMWAASDIGVVWQPQSPHSRVPGAKPFYPG